MYMRQSIPVAMFTIDVPKCLYSLKGMSWGWRNVWASCL